MVLLVLSDFVVAFESPPSEKLSLGAVSLDVDSLEVDSLEVDSLEVGSLELDDLGEDKFSFASVGAGNLLLTGADFSLSVVDWPKPELFSLRGLSAGGESVEDGVFEEDIIAPITVVI